MEELAVGTGESEESLLTAETLEVKGSLTAEFIIKSESRKLLYAQRNAMEPTWLMQPTERYSMI
jgi:hypothetical protein